MVADPNYIGHRGRPPPTPLGPGAVGGQVEQGWHPALFSHQLFPSDYTRLPPYPTPPFSLLPSSSPF